MYIIKQTNTRNEVTNTYMYRIVITSPNPSPHARGPFENVAYPIDFHTPEEALEVLGKMVGSSQK